MKNTKDAFLWIVSILKTEKVPFQISGGFAVRAYGSQRELADIDIEIARDGFEKIFEKVKGYIIFGPDQYRDQEWDLYLITLNYLGQEIDICDKAAKIFNKDINKWESLNKDYFLPNEMVLFGEKILVESPERLLFYKKKIQREVDLIDIAYLESLSRKS